MTRPARWWWLRHAPVPEAAGGRIHGRRDVPCDTSDAATFRALADLLPDGASAVVSPLDRTRQTFEALVEAGFRAVDTLLEPDFVEQSFGDWEGLSWPSMQALDPEAYAAFWLDPVRNAPPGGESFASQMRRTAAAIERLSPLLAGRDVLCVAHGGTIRAAVAHALALPPEAAMAIVVDTLSVTRLDRVEDRLLSGAGGVWRVQCVNAAARWPASPGVGD